MTVLSGGVFGSTADDLTDLRALVDDIGARSFESRIGKRGLPDSFDSIAWGHLEESGLTRLDSTPDSGAGPSEVAVVLRALYSNPTGLKEFPSTATLRTKSVGEEKGKGGGSGFNHLGGFFKSGKPFDEFMAAVKRALENLKKAALLTPQLFS